MNRRHEIASLHFKTLHYSLRLKLATCKSDDTLLRSHEYAPVRTRTVCARAGAHPALDRFLLLDSSTMVLCERCRRSVTLAQRAGFHSAPHGLHNSDMSLNAIRPVQLGVSKDCLPRALNQCAPDPSPAPWILLFTSSSLRQVHFDLRSTALPGTPSSHSSVLSPYPLVAFALQCWLLDRSRAHGPRAQGTKRVDVDGRNAD